MSYQAVERVYLHSTSEGSARTVLLYLAHRAQVDGTDARPSLLEIEAATRLSRKTVIAAVDRLELAGELAVERGRGRGQRTRYHVTVTASKKVEPDSTLNDDQEKVEWVESGSTLTEKVESVNSTFYEAEKVEPDSTANTRTQLDTNPEERETVRTPVAEPPACEGVRACEADGADFGWLESEKIPLAEWEEPYRAAIQQTWQKVSRVPVKGRPEAMYRNTFGIVADGKGGTTTRGVTGLQLPALVDLARRYPATWLCAAMVVASAKGARFTAVESFIQAWVKKLRPEAVADAGELSLGKALGPAPAVPAQGRRVPDSPPPGLSEQQAALELIRDRLDTDEPIAEQIARHFETVPDHPGRYVRRPSARLHKLAV